MQGNMFNNKHESKRYCKGDVLQQTQLTFSFSPNIDVNNSNSIFLIVEIDLKTIFRNKTAISKKAFDLSKYLEFPTDITSNQNLCKCAVALCLYQRPSRLPGKKIPIPPCLLMVWGNRYWFPIQNLQIFIFSPFTHGLLGSLLSFSSRGQNPARATSIAWLT